MNQALDRRGRRVLAKSAENYLDLRPYRSIFRLEKYQRFAAVYHNVLNFGDENSVVAGVLRSP